MRHAPSRHHVAAAAGAPDGSGAVGELVDEGCPERRARERPARRRPDGNAGSANSPDLSNGGTLEHAQQIAGHASPKTTKLYDRTADTITVDEIERIVI